jgi:hypothetical protein
MVKWLRALFWLAVLSGAGFAVYTALQRRNEPAAGPDLGPELRFEPLVSSGPVEPATASTRTEKDQAVQRWVATVDGVVPEGYPIKVNSKSGIYHVPGGRSYERTAADRRYASAEDAEADGYRRAKA